MNGRRVNARRRPAEVTIHLASVRDLFNPPEFDVTATYGLLVSGMEHLLEELTPRNVKRGVRVTLVLPTEQTGGGSQEELSLAIARYCDLRLYRLDLALRSQRRDGLGSLRIGLSLFLVGILFSYAFSRPDVPENLQLLLGSGAFLVLAWVGLWYPLDSLAFARRPLLRERRVWREIRKMELVLRTDQDHSDYPSPRPAGPDRSSRDDLMADGRRSNRT
ncbi:MAG: hypothetical protein M3082_21600 [Candidatus Dormibacteraeota bacterium]|nr:hypothetical protein [Candidatus Dormibacteraeota bacterium]